MAQTINRRPRAAAAGNFLRSLAVAFGFLLAALANGQTNSPAEAQSLALKEKEGCARNLKIIYDAIQAYQLDHKELPGWLSDLVPQYLTDVNVFICPVCKRTGEVESSPLADPKISCSYLYDFCGAPLGKSLSADPHATYREWKRRQMGLLGSMVPLVQCPHHAAVLNLSFDGRIYDSPANWETLFTNQVKLEDLSAQKLFPAPAGTNSTPPKAAVFPARDPDAKPNLIDLTAYYNVPLTESLHGVANNNLAALPAGLQTIGDIQFDVRGLIQLRGKSPRTKQFPTELKGIKIGQKCEKLHFLHAVAFGSPKEEGQPVGRYILHFATNQMVLEIPLVYGREVRNWHQMAGEKPGAPELRMVWSATNAVSNKTPDFIRLFETTWVNVAPGVEIKSLDFVSAMGATAPFLIAITAE